MKYLYFFRILVVTFFIGFTSTNIVAQNNCATATTVTDLTGAVCATSSVSNTNAIGGGGCEEGLFDTWFSFTAQGSTATINVSATTGGFRPEFVLASSSNNTCGGTFTAEDCFDQNGNYTAISGVVNGLVVGDTYWIIVSSNGDVTTGTLSVCVNNPVVSVDCVDNEDCSNAAPLVLNAPGGGFACVNDCNTGASPGPDFTGNNCYDLPNATVWYSITTSATTASLNITLNSSVMTTPEFTVFTDSCGPFTIVNCVEGTGGVATGSNIAVSANTTYLIAVSNVSGSSGAFDLCVEQVQDNSACNTNDGLTVSSTSMGSPLTGPYQPGEQVTFCYTVTDFQQINCNYIGAFVPTFGDCWDPSSFDAQGMPLIINTPLNVNGVIQPCPPGPPCPWSACVGQPVGAWNWFPAGAATYNVNGFYPAGTAMPAGWYFLSSFNPATSSCTGDPTDPDNTYGDGNFPNCGVNTFDYTICFTLTAGSAASCSGGFTDCTVSMKTFADGEFGAWNNIGCTVDAAISLPSTLQCCVPPDQPLVATTAPTCVADGTSTITNYDNLLTYTFTPAGPTAGAGGVISGMVLGTSYTVTAGNGSCTSVASASFTNLATLPVPSQPTISTTAPTCSSDGISTITNYSGALTYTFTPVGPSAGAGGLISGMTVGTSYTVIADNGSCSSVASASFSNVAMLITPAVPTITTTAPTCVAAGTSTITNYNGALTYTFTPAGPTAGAGGVISGMVVGTSYTVTAGNGSCTSVASASFTNLAVLPVPSQPTISTTAPTCSSDGVSTITNYSGALSYTFTPVGPSAGAGGVISGMSVGTSYTVTSSNGSCSSVASASFTILEQLASPVSPSVTVVDNEICVGQTGAFQINGSPNNVLTYSINSGSQQTVTLNSQGEALIEVNNSTTTIVIELLEIDNGSCSNSISITATIDVINCVIPKGVSPNNDGLNDTWDLSGFDAKQVQIFNRYGVEVYSKSNYTNEWGGRANNGNELPDGTYYYVVSLPSGEVKTGWVYINREN